MIPAAPDGTLRVGGLALRDHWFDVPLNHADPGGEQIQVYAREVAAVDKIEAEQPWLLFLQGGPGGKSPRPADPARWLGRAVKDYRVLLLDQRGTGLSTPVTPRTILRRGDATAQADYLAHFRADSIVADAELIRRWFLGDEQKWSVLGQSFGGFCTLTYLSFAPHGLQTAYLTGGLGPLDATADDVYRATYEVVRAKNNAYHEAFPDDRERLERIAAYLREHEVRLPDGSPLSVRRFQSIGMSFGARMSVPRGPLPPRRGVRRRDRRSGAVRHVPARGPERADVRAGAAVRHPARAAVRPGRGDSVGRRPGPAGGLRPRRLAAAHDR